MKQELLKLPVTQPDETPTQVINDGRATGSKSYMWVHRSGEKLRKVSCAGMVSVVISCLIEFTQYITQRGYLQTGDVIMNTIGGIAGYAVWKALTSQSCKS